MPQLQDAGVVYDLTYKPGWTVYLQAPDPDCPVYRLMIVSETPDSYRPERVIRVRHEFMVPPADYTTDVWLAWVFDRYRDVEAHEAGEFFMHKGQRLFAPHHGNGQDPYRVWFMSDYAHTRTRAGDDDV